jgi:hypothetical protein
MLGSRPHRWLAALPALLLLGGVPLANRVHAYVFGLPFLLFWIVACVLVTSLIMAVIATLDDRLDAAAERGAAAGPGLKSDPK